MGRRLLSSLALLLWGCGLASADITSNLSLKWTMDATSGTTVTDSSGGGHTGTVVGTTTPSWQTTGCQLAQCLALDGVDDKVTSTTTLGQVGTASALTLALWVKPTAPGIARTLVEQLPGLLVDGGAPGGYVGLFQGNPGGAGDQLWAYVYSGGTKKVGVPYVVGQWVHLTLVVNGSFLRFYVNGVLAQETAAGPIDSLSGTIQVGGNFGSTSTAYFRGVVDAVSIYGRALTASDVAQLCACPPQAQPTTPRGGLLPDVSQTAVTVTTVLPATCKWDTRPGTAYDTMPQRFTTTGALVHSFWVQGLSAGHTWTYYVRCRFPTQVMTSDAVLTFWVWPRPAEVVVFDSLLFTGKPDLASYGVRPTKTVYTQEFFASGVCGPSEEATTRAVADTIWASGYRGAVTLDVECQALDIRFASTATVDAGLAQHLEIQGWFRNQQPGLSTGYYYQPPISDIRGSDLTDPTALQEANDYLASLTAQANVLVPQAYNFDDDYAFWDAAMRLKVQEARRIGGMKPVYVFIWPEFHDQGPPNLAGTPLPKERWHNQLYLLYSLGVDGIILWGGYQHAWNDQAGWWQATKEFLRQINAMHQ
jgi:Concanavalin A-like lectin/glucanases superfamily